jgi:hypothetical protein
MNLGWLALMLMGGPLQTTPRYADPLPYLALPPALEDRLVYYRSFNAPGGKPEIDQLAAKELQAPVIGEGGLLGHCGVTGGPGKALLRLKSPGLSPAGPLTIMFWWSLPAGCAPNSGYGLLGLTGRGYISIFGRGGPWCGLSDVGAVLQCWSMDGIKNVNDIYDFRIRETLSLAQRGGWHHTALTVAGGRTVAVCTDGLPVTSVQLEGRPIGPQDDLTTLDLGADGGDGTLLAEVMVFQRTLTADEIADYVTAVRGLRAVGRLP